MAGTQQIKQYIDSPIHLIIIIGQASVYRVVRSVEGEGIIRSCQRRDLDSLYVKGNRAYLED